MTVRVVSQPAYLPVTVAEARGWCRLGSVTDHDAELALLIVAMARKAENMTGRAFMQRALELVLPGWTLIAVDGCGQLGIELPFPPLYQVTSIKYYDTDGVDQTLAADQYVVHGWHQPAFIVPAWQATWPTVRGVPDAVRVAFTAGYSAVGSPSDESAQQAGIPQDLKLWLHTNMATLFENREQIIVGGTIGEMPRTFGDGLLDALTVAERVV